MKFLYLLVVFLFLTLVNDSLHAEKTVPSIVGGASDHEQDKKRPRKKLMMLIVHTLDTILNMTRWTLLSNGF